MKLQEWYHFRATKDRIFLALHGPFDPGVNEIIKAFPGVHWGPTRGRERAWIVPVELRERLGAAMEKKIGYAPKFVLESSPAQEHGFPDLRPWQNQFFQFVRAWGGGGAFFEQGLGKSVAVLRSKIGKTIVVVPPGTIATMMKQIERWMPLAVTHRFDTATKKQWPPPENWEILVTTYTLIDDDRILDPALRVGTIIYDEAHHLKNYKSGRSKAAKKLRDVFPHARVILATGTPQGEGFHEWYQYADLIWPGRFGYPNQFLDRYVLREAIPGLDEDDPRRRIAGINPEHADEFRERIAALGVRVVKNDIKDQLPPLEFQAEWQSVSKGRASIEKLFASGGSDEAFRQHMRLVSAQKVAPTLEAISNALENGASKIFVAGWFKGFVEAIGAGARELAADYGVEVIVTTGGGVGRDEALARAEKAERAIVVATIASVAEGRNELAQYPLGILGEIHYSPIIMSQLFARLHRLDTMMPVTIKAILVKDSLDERIAEIMSGKVEDQNQVIKLGLFEQAWKDEVGDKRDLVEDAGWREALSAEINTVADPWLE